MDLPDWKKSFERGMLALGNADHTLAESEFSAAYQQEPSDPDLVANYALVLIHKKDYEAAQKILDAILLLHSTHHDSLINRGLIEMRLKKWHSALSYFHQALQSNPLSYVAMRNIGNCYGHLGLYQTAARYIEEALRVYPGYTDAHIDLGVICLMANRPELAKEIFSKVCEYNPRNEKSKKFLLEVQEIIRKASSHGSLEQK